MKETGELVWHTKAIEGHFKLSFPLIDMFSTNNCGTFPGVFGRLTGREAMHIDYIFDYIEKYI
jgi:hypothetical protein